MPKYSVPPYDDPQRSAVERKHDSFEIDFFVNESSTEILIICPYLDSATILSKGPLTPLFSCEVTLRLVHKIQKPWN